MMNAVPLKRIMTLSARPASRDDALPWRGGYRLEMACQVIHDSIHDRNGWTQEFLLRDDDGGADIGYGSLAVAGPWKERPTVYEFFVAPPWRWRIFDAFEALLAGCRADRLETQSNDSLLTAMLHVYCRDVASESILFDDRIRTHLPAPPGITFRAARPRDKQRLPEDQRGADYLLVTDGKGRGGDGAIAATGGLLWHYNRPYGDLYMHVEESWRQRGLGAYLVQEIKRACYERGSVPGARCNVDNVASRKTLQKAGFVPCGHILTGTIAPRG
jgi:GNAT superfamily N-acetyltransferase